MKKVDLINLENMKEAWYQKKWVTVCWHIMAWLIVFSLPYLLWLIYKENTPIREDPDGKGYFYLSLLTGFLWMGLFYLNAFVLIPKNNHNLLTKNKMWKFLKYTFIY